jgi:peptide deformylase
MAVKEIVKDKRALSIPCKETTLEEAKEVIQDLMDTAHKHKKNCLGLASNQIGSNLRVMVVKIKGKFKAFINPSYTKEGQMFDSTEGCLSFPDKLSKVRRCALIYTTLPTKKKGKSDYMIMSGLSAVAFQHECDHLDGKII